MDNRHRSFFFIVNPFSGKGIVSRLEHGIRDICVERRVDYQIAFTTGPRHATELAQQAVAEGFSNVVAVGGDGTINEVAQGVVNTSAAMGIIPKGSGNGLARHIGIPLQVEAALASLFNSKITPIDTLEVNGYLSLNVSGIGFDGLVAARFAERRRRGLPGYVRLVARGYGRFKEFKAVLKSQGKTFHRSAFVIAIANSSQYGNNARIAPDASLCDQRLNLVIIKKFPVYRLDIISSLFNGKITNSRWLEMLEVEEVEIDTNAPIPWHVDGEPIPPSDRFVIRLNPNSLSLLVPPQALP